MGITIVFTPEGARAVIAALRREARMWGAMTGGCRLCGQIADVMEEELREALAQAEARAEGKEVPMPTPPYSSGF